MTIDPNEMCNKGCRKTLCNADTKNNSWCSVDTFGVVTECRLDDITYGDVIYVISRNQKFMNDLKKVTTDETLLYIANNTQLVGDEKDQNAKFTKNINGGAPPFYTVFGGQL